MGKRLTKTFCFLLVTPLCFTGQTDATLGLAECLQQGLSQNPTVKANEADLHYQQRLKPAAFDIPKTTIIYTQGQFNSIYKYDNNITISQLFPYPGLYSSQLKLAGSNIRSAELKLNAAKAEIAFHIKDAYYRLQHAIREARLYHYEDSIYSVTLQPSDTDDLSELEAVTHSYMVKSYAVSADANVNSCLLHLQSHINLEKRPNIRDSPEEFLPVVTDTVERPAAGHPLSRLSQEQITTRRLGAQVERSKTAPDVILSYFNQSIYGPANIFGTDYFLTTANRLQGFQVGLTLPLFYGSHQAKIRGAMLHAQAAEAEYQLRVSEMHMQADQALSRYRAARKNLEYFNEHLLRNMRKHRSLLREQFISGKTDRHHFLEAISKSFDTERHYLKLVLENNLAAAQLEYFHEKN